VIEKLREACDSTQRLRSFLLRFYPEVIDNSNQHQMSNNYEAMAQDLLQNHLDEALLTNLAGWLKLAPAVDEKTKGLFQKYRVQRSDGKTIPPTALFFSLRYDKPTPEAAAARKALQVYAEEIGKLGYNKLAEELSEALRASTGAGSK
jgi:hypothetical protein